MCVHVDIDTFIDSYISFRIVERVYNTCQAALLKTKTEEREGDEKKGREREKKGNKIHMEKIIRDLQVFFQKTFENIYR